MNSKINAKCKYCQKQLTCNTFIKFTFKTCNTNNFSNIDNVIIICESCFDEDKFEQLCDEMFMDCDFPLQIFMSSKQLYVDKKEWKKYSKSKIISTQKTKRIQELIKKMSDVKLSYEEHSKNKLCESYVNCGSPDLDTVIKSLYSIISIENDRLFKLLETLKLLNLEYDSKIPSYKKFIKKGGDINKIINSAELEKDLIKNTNYLSLYDITDSDTAKEMVVGKIETKTKRVEKYITKKNTIKFD